MPNAQNVSIRNPLPKQTADSDIAAQEIYVDEYDSGRAYNAVTGKMPLGLADVADIKVNLKPEVVDINSGSPEISLEKLVKSHKGEWSAAIQDLNDLGIEVGNGNTLPTIYVEPGTPVTATIAGSGSTEKLVKVASTTGFTAGKQILIPLANGKTVRGKIKSVPNSTDINLVYELSEVPLAAGTVKLLVGKTNHSGGGELAVREMVMKSSFQKGSMVHNVMYRTYSTGGFDQTRVNDKTKTMMSGSLEGHSIDLGGSLGYQLVPMSQYTTF
jgi:hypothetical protein